MLSSLKLGFGFRFHEKNGGEVGSKNSVFVRMLSFKNVLNFVPKLKAIIR